MRAWQQRRSTLQVWLRRYDARLRQDASEGLTRLKPSHDASLGLKAWRNSAVHLLSQQSTVFGCPIGPSGWVANTHRRVTGAHIQGVDRQSSSVPSSATGTTGTPALIAI